MKSKRIGAFLLAAVVLLASVMPISADASFHGWSFDIHEEGEWVLQQGNYSVELSKDLDTLTIRGSGNLVVPYKIWYNGWDPSGMAPELYPAVIVIEEGIESINSPGEGYSFHKSEENCRIVEIQLPSSLKVIGGSSFAGCSHVTSLSLPGGLEEIGGNAFWGLGISSLQLPGSLRTLGGGAFGGCKNLTSVSIPNTVTSLGIGAFQECSSLTTATLPAGLTILPRYLFAECTSLRTVSIPDTVTVIEDDAFRNSGISSITFPEGLLSINHGAFRNTNLTSVSFPDSLEGIGIEAFAGTPLTEAVIPESVTYIGDGAFPAGEQFTIYGYRGTTAHGFALNNGNTFVALDGCDIKVSVKDEDVVRRDIFSGTVMNGDSTAPERGFPVKITVTPDNDTFTDVSLDLTLPEGFSFSPDEIVTEKGFDAEALTEETTISPMIYPIYLGDLEKTDAYHLTVQISGTDSTGEQEGGRTSVAFFSPAKVNNSVFIENGFMKSAVDYVEEFLQGHIDDNRYNDDLWYEFDLSTARGSGTTYDYDTEMLAVKLCGAAYDRNVIKQFLEELGFDGIETGDHTFAHKRIIEDGEIKYLIWGVSRGTNDGDVYLGNFNVGNGDDHQAYRAAADTLEIKLGNYLERLGLYEEDPYDCYLLLTGYSQGAAAVNMVANHLNNEMDHYIVGKENLSVYTFGCPNVSKNALNDTGNENVFNLLHYMDLNLNAPSMQYYGRYGETRVFAVDAFEYSSFGYDEYMPAVSGTLMVENPTTQWHAVSILAKVKMDHMGLLNHDNFKYCHDLFTYRHLPDVGIITEEAAAEKLKAAVDNYRSRGFFAPVNAFACPVNIYVEDASGTAVAQIVDGESSSSVPEVHVQCMDDTKYVVIGESAAEDYTIRVEAYDYGVMSHGIIASENDGETYALSARENIPLVPGESYYVGAGEYITLDGEDENDTAAHYQTHTDESSFDAVLIHEQIRFSDVTSPDEWFYAPVYAAANANIVAGTQDGTFLPYATLTWSQTVTFAVRLAQYKAGEHVYTAADQQGVWYQVYADYALEHGFVDAIPADPDGVITRGDAAVIFAAVLGDAEQVNDVPDGYFTDVDAGSPAYDGVYALSRAGITNGKGGGLFDPEGIFTRCEVAAIVARMAGLVAKAEI